MMVRVEVMPWLSELLSGEISKKFDMIEPLQEGETVRELLRQLHARHPRFGRMVFDPERDHLTGHAEIAINGTPSHLAGGLDTQLHEGDIVTFLAGIAGG
jgi:molybdopterin converting factor small subunit